MIWQIYLYILLYIVLLSTLSDTLVWFAAYILIVSILKIRLGKISVKIVGKN